MVEPFVLVSTIPLVSIRDRTFEQTSCGGGVISGDEILPFVA